MPGHSTLRYYAHAACMHAGTQTCAWHARHMHMNRQHSATCTCLPPPCPTLPATTHLAPSSTIPTPVLPSTCLTACHTLPAAFFPFLPSLLHVIGCFCAGGGLGGTATSSLRLHLLLPAPYYKAGSLASPRLPLPPPSLPQTGGGGLGHVLQAGSWTAAPCHLPATCLPHPLPTNPATCLTPSPSLPSLSTPPQTYLPLPTHTTSFHFPTGFETGEFGHCLSLVPACFSHLLHP